MPVHHTKPISGIGTTAVAFDPAVEFHQPAAGVRPHRALLVLNTGSTTLGVNHAGTASAVPGEDVESIAPGKGRVFPYRTLSIVSSAAGGACEVSGDAGRFA